MSDDISLRAAAIAGAVSVLLVAAAVAVDLATGLDTARESIAGQTYVLLSNVAVIPIGWATIELARDALAESGGETDG